MKNKIIILLLLSLVFVSSCSLGLEGITGRVVLENTLNEEEENERLELIEELDRLLEEINSPFIDLETRENKHIFNFLLPKRSGTYAPYYEVYDQPIKIDYEIESDWIVSIYFLKSEEDWRKSTKLDGVEENFEFFCESRGKKLKGSCEIDSGGFGIINSGSNIINVSMNLTIAPINKE
ncbi:MAG: hypothetical protein QGF74_01975 [Candidatus Nanoarchaeia archaeon]|jgi:hypothetical protein|nr:hypothetical protein [Candidatus Nanoarchaeia archaeon]|tara:strand:+ start:39725 stop:40261 length:537 start_codon:yes stop_codon:yes gene_type:complete